jgi:hypothetical protein
MFGCRVPPTLNTCTWRNGLHAAVARSTCQLRVYRYVEKFGRACLVLGQDGNWSFKWVDCVENVKGEVMRTQAVVMLACDCETGRKARLEAGVGSAGRPVPLAVLRLRALNDCGSSFGGGRVRINHSIKKLNKKILQYIQYIYTTTHAGTRTRMAICERLESAHQQDRRSTSHQARLIVYCRMHLKSVTMWIRWSSRNTVIAIRDMPVVQVRVRCMDMTCSQNAQIHNTNAGVQTRVVVGVFKHAITHTLRSKDQVKTTLLGIKILEQTNKESTRENHNSALKITIPTYTTQLLIHLHTVNALLDLACLFMHNLCSYTVMPHYPHPLPLVTPHAQVLALLPGSFLVTGFCRFDGLPSWACCWRRCWELLPLKWGALVK